MKRKREAYELEDDSASRLRGKLHHGIKEVKKASKRVKIFETQKIVKRLKDARKEKNNELIRTLEKQLETIKHIDVERIAVEALRSKIKKDTILSRSSDCQSAAQAELPAVKADRGETIKEHAVVESRLLSSKVLAKGTADVIQMLRSVLGEESGSRKAASLTREAKESDMESEVEGDEQDGTCDDSGQSWTGFQDEDKDSSENIDDDDDEDEDEKLGDESDDENGLGWESGTVYSHGSDDEQASTSDNSASSPQKTAKKAPPGPSKNSGNIRKPGESTFLPSLSVGFVDGGSDSDWSDAEADAADAPMKKNRRGQRARKAIWEKKYGKNANHLKKQRELENAASETWGGASRTYSEQGRGAFSGASVRGRGRGGSTRGRGSEGRLDASARPQAGYEHGHAREERGRGRGHGRARGGSVHQAPPRDGHGAATNVRPGERGYSGSGGRGSSNAEPQPQHARLQRARGEMQEKPLHPSWEAKRKLKAKESAAILPAQGTRIKFT